MAKDPCVYIITNKGNTVLYTGVTSDLSSRIYAHKQGRGGVFSSKYKLSKLVYTEHFPTMMQAIEAEKHIKAGSRAKKITLIEDMNPEWRDLYDDL